ncbi:hypothetical protein CDL15_Pgr000053 [Punica granatum]|uniref:Uncharacterized protein n=1 Tax=Punica granatum TaxID=22663 RepID=A0A218VQE8_PUNGR|nr:hypothetical protein CDL15_Pgr000053 [Punica granatum]
MGSESRHGLLLVYMTPFFSLVTILRVSTILCHLSRGVHSSSLSASSDFY